MKIVFKLLYSLTIGFIVSCILLLILMNAFPLDFSDERYSDIFDSVVFAGIPIAILLTLSRLGFKVRLTKSQVRSSILCTILLSAGCFILFIFYSLATLGTSMCAWSSGEVLYRNNTKSSQKIIKRYFGCGATDSSPASAAVFEVQQVTPLLIYVTKVDTTKLDRRNWTRVNQ
jgi:hypothetical protein